MYYIKGGFSYNDYILLTNDYGRYSSYISFLTKLHTELMSIAEEKKEPQVIEPEKSVIVITEPKQEIEPRGVKRLIRKLIGR